MRADANGNISIKALQNYVAVVVPQNGSQEPTGYGLDERGGELIIAKAAQLYDAERLRAWRKLVNDLDSNDEITEQLANELRAVISRNQPKRDKAQFDLLNQLFEQHIKLGKFISQWHALPLTTINQQEAHKPSALSSPPKAKEPAVTEPIVKPANVPPAIQRPTIKPAPPSSPPKAKEPVATEPVFKPANVPPAIHLQRPAITPTKPETVVRGTGFTDDLKGIKLEMVYVPGGKFTMGSSDGRDSEKPPHPVTVPNFYMGKFQVTQAQWQAVMGKNPSTFKGDDLPVECVMWNDAQSFCQQLSQMTGKAYRLPTEAEWEYACRAGTETAFAFGNSLSSEQANFDGDNRGSGEGVYRRKTTPVGSFQPNAFGFHDMHGNVWEWCEDVWHENYNDAPDNGSAWVQGGNQKQKRRVQRGGSWYDSSRDCCSASRYDHFRGSEVHQFGFRVVVSARTQ